MKYNQLEITSYKSRKRAGRGISAGRGKTAGRGTKGQSSRSGGKRRPGFEGGQNPLYLRLPKLPGFTSKKTPAQTVLTSDLEANFPARTVINASKLYDKNLIKSAYRPVKLLAGGNVSKPFSVELQSASQGAINIIESVQGSVKIVPRLTRDKIKK